MNLSIAKSQPVRSEESVLPLPNFGLSEGLNASIGDGDFRTYVLLCQLAWQEHPEAADPYTERTYAEIAALHPGRRPPTAETVRGRLYRLAKQGLLRRQRAGRTTWQTVPLMEKAGAIFLTRAHQHPQAAPVGGHSQHTQAGPVGGHSQHTQAGPVGGQFQHTQAGPVGGHSQHTQDQATPPLSVRPQHTQAGPVGGHSQHTQDQATPPLSVRPQHTQEWEVAVGVRTQPTQNQTAPVGALHQHTQTTSLSGHSQHTQDPASPLSVRPQHTQDQTTALGVRPQHTQDQTTAVGALPQHTQATSLGVRAQHTHDLATPLGALPQHTQDSVTPLSVRPQHTHDSAAPLGVRPQHTQGALDGAGCAAPTHPRAGLPAPTHAYTRAHASVLITSEGTDPLSGSSSSYQGEDQSISTEARTAKNDLAPAKANPAKANPAKANPDETVSLDHPVFRLVTVPKGWEALAVRLATLDPQGMNYEGIQECLAQPERTQAWTDYVLQAPYPIRNPAAYIRRGVRSGADPALVTKRPAPHQARPAEIDGLTPDLLAYEASYLRYYRQGVPAPKPLMEKWRREGTLPADAPDQPPIPSLEDLRVH